MTLLLACRRLMIAGPAGRGAWCAALAAATSLLMPLTEVAVAQGAAAKTKAAAHKSSKTGDGDGHSGKPGQAIVVLVNDEPITAYEIEQRQRFMGLQSNIGEKVQANFKNLLQRPETTEHLKSILNETIKANQTKSKEQIIAIFEERKKQYALSLQKQAVGRD